MNINDFQECLCDSLTSSVMFAEFLQVTLTPAAVKQDVNFLESSEISLHKITVNLKTEDVKADLAQLLIKLYKHLNKN